MDKEVAAGTPAERIVVGGFSQGGAIALYSLRYPLKLAGVVGAPLSTGPTPLPAVRVIMGGRMLHRGGRWKGVPARLRRSHVCYARSTMRRSGARRRLSSATHAAGLSTYLPLRNEGAILSSEAAGTPVFMGHGTQDELIPLSWGQTSGDLLKDKGAAVELKSYPMGHSASETELQDLTRFLRRVLP